MFGAPAHGLPQLLLPQGAEQFINADACRNAGVALSLAGAEVTVESVASAVTRLLNEPTFTARARAVRAEVESMPCADDVLATLVRRPVSGAQECEYGEHPPVIAGIRGEVQFREDAAHMGLDRLATEVQLRGQRAVGTTLGHQGQHVPLPFGQNVE